MAGRINDRKLIKFAREKKRRLHCRLLKDINYIARHTKQTPFNTSGRTFCFQNCTTTVNLFYTLMQNMLKYDLPSVQNFYKILRIPASLAQQRSKKRDFQFYFVKWNFTLKETRCEGFLLGVFTYFLQLHSQRTYNRY